MASTNDMNDTNGPTESSVVVNLAGLMRLEEQRLAAEREAEASARRKAEARAREASQHEQDRHAQARNEAARRARSERDEEARFALRREAALLQVRAEVEAKERVEAQRLAQEHERKLRALAQEGRGAGRARQLSMALGLVVTTGLAGYFVIVAPQLEAAQLSVEHAEGLALRQARRNAELARRVSELEAKRDNASTEEVTASPTSAEPEPERTSTEHVATTKLPTSAAKSGSSRTGHPLPTKTPPRTRPAVSDATELDEVLGDDTDPISGLPRAESKAPRMRAKK